MHVLEDFVQHFVLGWDIRLLLSSVSEGSWDTEKMCKR